MPRACKFVCVSGTERQRGDLQEAERNGGEDKKSSCFAKDGDIGVSEEESKCALQVHHVCEYGSFHSAMSCVRHLPVSLPASTETSQDLHFDIAVLSFVVDLDLVVLRYRHQFSRTLTSIAKPHTRRHRSKQNSKCRQLLCKMSIKLCSKGFDTILVLMTLENVSVHASSLTSSSTMLVDVRVYC